jgi:hypothetical protein
MALSRKSEKRQSKIKKRKERWEGGKSNLQKAALMIKKGLGWSSKSKGIVSRAVGKFGENVEERQSKTTATDRHKTFKSDRKLPLGEKSFNKGKPKSEWVKSAYERRQKDATKRTQDAAKANHDAFQKKHGRGKYSKRAIEKRKSK